jgi:ABC-type bacteriocin/lantibiotic exporter with double-glycine peptidase domain
MSASETKKPPKSERFKAMWPDLWALVRPRRALLLLGLLLMAVNRVSGLVLPASTKYLIDDVIARRRTDLLLPLVAAVVGATLLQGLTSFALTQSLSKAAQRLIAELRRNIQAHVGRLPIAYFDANKSGALVSRIMNDVEGLRNLIGTGLVEFVGGLFTAALALAVMLWLSPAMTGVTALSLLVFGGFLLSAFSTMRPIFKERGKIYAEVTGRLTESLVTTPSRAKSGSSARAWLASWPMSSRPSPPPRFSASRPPRSSASSERRSCTSALARCWPAASLWEASSPTRCSSASWWRPSSRSSRSARS